MAELRDLAEFEYKRHTLTPLEHRQVRRRIRFGWFYDLVEGAPVSSQHMTLLSESCIVRFVDGIRYPKKGEVDMTIKKRLTWFVGVAAALLVAVLIACAGCAPKDHTMTFSGWIFENLDEDEFRDGFEEYNCTDITKNEDGSWSITMPGDEYERYVADLKEGMQKTFDKLVESEDWPNVAAVESNEDYSEVTITLKTDIETLMDMFAPVAVGLSASIYQQACDLPVSCHIVTLGADGTQLNEVTYPSAASE